MRTFLNSWNAFPQRAGADWSRKAALAYMDEAAHFWECPRGTHPRLRGEGVEVREIFGKLLAKW